jgi:hypothetical protein
MVKSIEKKHTVVTESGLGLLITPFSVCSGEVVEEKTNEKIFG